MADKSKILLIGGTGYIGKFIVEASIKEGHPTFVLVRESTLSLSSPAKSIVINNFNNLGVNFLIGDLLDHESLVKAIKQVDVVISSIAHDQVDNQVNIIAAIKESGNIKSLQMMWIERILLNQQQDWLLQRLKFDELLRLKEFLTHVWHLILSLVSFFQL